MRDIGIFTSKVVSTGDLLEFMGAYAARVGEHFERRTDESIIGDFPDVLYVSNDTAATNGYFSEDERKKISASLGVEPEGYISIHFKTDAAFARADAIAHEMGRLWQGMIDYSGSGGDLNVPPVT